MMEKDGGDTDSNTGKDRGSKKEEGGNDGRMRQRERERERERENEQGGEDKEKQKWKTRTS